MKLKNKVAIITGSGKGIGRAIALAFARESANLVLVSRTLRDVMEVAAQVQTIGCQVCAVEADISKEDDVKNVVTTTLREFQRVDVLVNNAGVLGPIGPLVKNDIKQWIETIHVNLIGTFLCCKAVLPVMIKHRRGKIINFSGGGATSPRPRFSAYSASKAAVVRLTETLAEELKEFNIQVNAIAPGAVNTRMLYQVLDAGDAAGERALTEAKRQLETEGTPIDVPAALAVFLASDESNGLTGRLISAVWDDWRNMSKRIPEIMSTDIYTLRRVTSLKKAFSENWFNRCGSTR